MIPVARANEPACFDNTVRKPGRKWLAAHPGAKRPKPLWSAVITNLENHFHKLCGYAAMLDPTGGTVDHYMSYGNHTNLAYEWDNYRFASGPLNSSKAMPTMPFWIPTK